MPPIPPPQGVLLHHRLTNSAAINNEGTRFIIDNHPAVDIWDAAKGTCVRSMTMKDWAYHSHTIIAQDASGFYVRNDKTNKLEAHNAKGSITGTAPQVGFVPTHYLKRIGYDFAPRDYVMGTKIPLDNGVYALDPRTGAQRLVIRVDNIHDVDGCKALLARPDGGFFAYYRSGFAHLRLGLYAIAKNGRHTKYPGIPSAGIKEIVNASISPDGRYLMFQGSDRLEVWDMEVRTLVLDWRGQFRSPLGGRFIGDGRLAVLSIGTNLQEIATSGLTGGYKPHTARLDVLEIPSGRAAGQLSLSEFNELIPTFAFSPNGSQLVVADHEQIVLVNVESAFPHK